jgi:hypothetical protein
MFEPCKLELRFVVCRVLLAELRNTRLMGGSHEVVPIRTLVSAKPLVAKPCCYSSETYIQLLEAPRETPYGRELRGQISATKIQAQGPQEYPKCMTKSHTIETAAHPAAGFSCHWSTFFAKMMAIIMWHADMPSAPTANTGLRPVRSIQRTAGIVATNMAWDLH